MTKKIKSNYGYTRFEIDHTYSVWVCKITLDASASIPVIGGVKVDIAEITRKYKTKRMLVLSYCTTDWSEHDRMQRAITLYLEQHAIDKIKRKHAWAHEEDIPSEQELSLPVYEYTEKEKDEAPLPW